MPDWKKIRADFPALDQQVNGKPLVYLDNAATTQKPRAVIGALARFYERDNANVHRGLHALSMRATDAYEGARARVRAFVNAAESEEIVFTRGTTESINLVAASWGGANLRAGDVILLTEMEHHSNLVPWQLVAQRTGAKLRYVPVNGDEGLLDLSRLDRLLTPEVKIFAFTHVSNTLGTINPAAALCARAKKAGVVTVVDAAQSIGHMPVDVRAIGCDFLAFSGHKMAGVTGIGVLYGRRALLDAMPPWQGGGGMITNVDFMESRWKPSPERFEAGTPNFADAFALGVACDYLEGIGRAEIQRHDGALARRAYEKLGQIPGIRLLGPRGERGGLVSFALGSVHAHDVVTFADQDGIALRGGHHCNQPLMKKLGLTGTARASFYVYNTEEEIDILVASLRRIVKFFPVNPDLSKNPLLADASARAIRYLNGMDSRSVAPAPSAVEALRTFDEKLPEKPSDPAETLRLLDEVGSPATTAVAGPRFFGFVTGGSLPVTLAANWLAGAWDQNTKLFRSTPGTSFLEQVALRWLLDLLRLPADCTGAFVTGATVANLCALAAARHGVLKKAGWDVEGQGLFGAPGITVIVGEEVHPSVTKSLGILGMGRNRVVRVPVDRQGRMRADRLPPISGATIVCVQAGNVNTGAIDPIEAIRQKAHAAGAWLHVDGAFGLWAAAAPSLRKLTAGIPEADSWATDAHKWLNVPYDCGMAFVRDRDALKAAMSISAEYLPTQSEFRNPSDFTPELSRRARGVEVWAALRSLGREGIAEIIERNCAQARRFAEKLSAAGFEILNEVTLNQVLVSFGSADETTRIIQAIQDEGTCWCGITVWQGKTAMRVSVSSWATTDADVDRSIAAIVRTARGNRS